MSDTPPLPVRLWSAYEAPVSPVPYYADDAVTLYLGDSTELVTALMRDGFMADCIVTDPPYGETSLDWDIWPDRWPSVMSGVTTSMWVFGSMRMFLDRRDEFADWKLSQDVVWEKHNGTGFAADRFKRVHEHALHWYRGNWANVHKDVPRVAYNGPDKSAKQGRDGITHTGAIKAHYYVDDGTRLMKSVQRVPSLRGVGRHPTEKPVPVVAPLIEYSCPPGGLVLDPFAGSGSTLDAARSTGRRAVGIEGRPDYCEAIVRRLAQGDLFGGVA